MSLHHEIPPSDNVKVANKRRSNNELNEIDAIVERLREFIRFGYVTGAEVARANRRDGWGALFLVPGRISTGESKAHLGFLRLYSNRIESGISPTGYPHREYKNWRGIPKPRRCPFCKKAKGEVRKVRGGFLGVCPNCGASGPKRESGDEALKAWN